MEIFITMATKRLVYVMIGSIFVVLAIIGLFLPVVPTSPFLLVAAACYARSSDTLYNKLLSNPMFGPVIRQWRDSGTMPKKAKWASIVLIAVSFSVTIAVFLTGMTARIIMGLIGLIVIAILYRIPGRD